MLFRCFVYFCCYLDMILCFGRFVLVFSMVINIVLDYIYDIYGYLLIDWNLVLLSV